MNPSKSGEEQILLTVADQSKLDLVMELLSHFDLVQAQRIKVAIPAPAASSAIGSDEDFWALAGLWKGRNIDLERMRQESFARRTTQHDQ